MAAKSRRAKSLSGRLESIEVVEDRVAESRNGSVTLVAGPPSHEQVLFRRLSRIDELDAAFISSDDDGMIHVYSVVPDYSDSLYSKLLKQERLVERELPQTRFEFHVRAHQGRESIRAVPYGSKPIFVR